MASTAYVTLSDDPGSRGNHSGMTPGFGGTVTWQAVLLGDDNAYIPLNPADVGDADQGQAGFSYGDSASDIRDAVVTSVQAAYDDDTISVVFIS